MGFVDHSLSVMFSLLRVVWVEWMQSRCREVLPLSFRVLEEVRAVVAVKVAACTPDSCEGVKESAFTCARP